MGKQRPQRARERLPVGEQAEVILHRERTEKLGEQTLQDLDRLYEQGRKIADRINEGRDINGQVIDELSDLYGKVDQLQKTTESFREVYSDAEIAEIQRELTAFEDWIDALDKQANALLATAVEKIRVETKEGADAFNHIINLDYWHKNINSKTPFSPEERANVLIGYLDGKFTREELLEFVYKKHWDAFLKLVDELVITPKEQDPMYEVPLSFEPVAEKKIPEPAVEPVVEVEVPEVKAQEVRERDTETPIARELRVDFEGAQKRFLRLKRQVEKMDDPRGTENTFAAIHDDLDLIEEGILRNKAEMQNFKEALASVRTVKKDFDRLQNLAIAKTDAILASEPEESIDEPVSPQTPEVVPVPSPEPETTALVLRNPRSEKNIEKKTRRPEIPEVSKEEREETLERQIFGHERYLDLLLDMYNTDRANHRDLQALVRKLGQDLDGIAQGLEGQIKNEKNADSLRTRLHGLQEKCAELKQKLALERSPEATPPKELEVPIQVESQTAVATEELAPVESSNRESTPRPAPKVIRRPGRRGLSNPVPEVNREEPIPVMVEVEDEFPELPVTPPKPKKMRKPKMFEPWKPSKEEQAAAARIPFEQISPADHRPASYKDTKTFGDQVRSGLNYLLSRGEEKEAEKGDDEPQVSRSAMLAVGLMDAMKKVASVRILPDVVRYLPDRYFSRKERDDLQQAVMEMNNYSYLSSKPEIQAREEKRFSEKRAALLKRIEESPFLTEAKREKMLMRTKELVVHYETAKEGANQAYNKELAEIISKNLETRRVTGDEGTIASLAGKYLGKGIASVSSVIGRLRRMTHEDADGVRAKESVRRNAVDGFAARWRRVIPERVLNWRKVGPPPDESPKERARQIPSALQKLSTRAGIAMIALGIPGKLDAEAFHAQVENLLAANEATQSSHLQETVSIEGERTIADATDTSRARVEVDEAEVSAIEVPADFHEAVVHHEDGITQALSRYVARNPHLYGYKGPDDDAARQRFATKFAVLTAQKDGLLHTWLSAMSVDAVAILPIEKADGWHVAFIDAKTHEVLEGEDLKPYLQKEKKRTTTKPRA